MLAADFLATEIWFFNGDKKSHLISRTPVAVLEVSLDLITFCGKTGELERDRDCKKTFSDVFKSVFMRRALSDGESKLLFGCLKLELLISFFFRLFCYTVNNLSRNYR